MFKKRIVSLMTLIVFILCTTVNGYAFSSENTDADSSTFITAVSELIRDNWEDSYFSAITMELGSPELEIDGEVILSAPAVLEDEELVLPLADIAAAIGETVPDNETFRRFGSVFTLDSLGLEAHLHDNVVTIVKPYQMKQLVVQTISGNPLHNDYGAVQSVTSGQGLHLLLYSSEADTKAAREALQMDSDVLYALPNQVVYTEEPILPLALPADERWGSERISADLYKQYLSDNNKIDEIIVAVVDSGIDTTHPHFDGRLKLVQGANFIDPDEHEMIDDSKHGSHVAGTIVDCTPENVKIMPVRVLGTGGTNLQIKLGIEHAAYNGADIMNLSLGENCFEDDCLLERAVDYAVSKGVTVVVAAGNETSDTENLCPAKLDNVITVAAIDENDIQALFSNFGEAVDVAAPGVNIYSSVPGGGYEYMRGTSMATPHVVAAAALLKLDDSTLTPQQMREAIRGTTVDIGIPGWDNLTGTGIVDLRIRLGHSVPVSEMAFSNDVFEIDYTQLDNKYLLIPAFTPANATNKSVTLASDNESVATIDGSGRVVINGAGTATLTATAHNGVNTTSTLNVAGSQYWVDYAAANYAGGTGTQDSPYLISNAPELAKLSYDVYINHHDMEGLYFKLTADIDLDGKEWTPIYYGEQGNGIVSERLFKGHFDGNYHTVKNMKIVASPDENMPYVCVGLFGGIDGGTVKNLAVLDAYVDAGPNDSEKSVGILAGRANFGSVVTNCYTTGWSSGVGLVGKSGMPTSVIGNCFSSADTVQAGLIWADNGSLIYNSYARGDVTHVRDDDVYLDSHGAGFLISFHDLLESGGVINSFAANTPVSGNGFISLKNDGIIDKCYYLTDNPRGIETYLEPESTDLTAVDVSFFKNLDNFLNQDNWNSQYPWDFENTWAISDEINDGFPYLKGFYSSATVPVIETNPSMPDGIVGTAYSQTLTATGTTPITWSIDSGSLPAGLTLSGNIISGTPTTAETQTFTVKATNSAGSDTKSMSITISAAPSYVVTVNGSYAGTTGAGSYAQGATVTISAGSRSNYSFSGWTVNSGGVTLANANSATTTFTMPGGAVSVTANWSYNGGGGGSGGGGSSTPDPTPNPTPDPTPTPAPTTPPSSVIVDGKEVNAGEVEIKDDTTTVTVNQDAINKQLETASDNVTVVIPAETGTAVAQIVVQNVDDMASKDMTLTVQVGDVAYEIPATAIDTSAILATLGAENADDVQISIIITTDMSEAAQASVNAAVEASGSTLVFPPMEFKLTANYEGKTVEIGTFSQYVSRSVEITKEQAAKITTAIVVDPDGTTRQVPTNVYQKDGKWYVEINSLTNSTYALVYNDVAFTDAKGKWYESAVNEMGSRMIISGIGDNLFAGERDITRAEFASILVRALGLPSNGDGTVFTDVAKSAWYCGAVGTAHEYGLVSGIGNNQYAPEKRITRQEAMLMIQRAAAIAGFKGEKGNLNSFTDADTISSWAHDAAVWNVGSGLIVGSDGMIRGGDNITRAETATLVLKLMQNAGLVDIRTSFSNAETSVTV